MTYTTRLHAALGMNDGLLAITWDPMTIEVAWPEPLPATLDPLIAEAAADGITVVWLEIPMSQEEAEALVEQLAEALTAAGIPWTAIGPDRGYAGIQVDTPTALDEAARGRIRQLAAEAAPRMSITFGVRSPISDLMTEVGAPAP